jgi:recombination protein RecA
VVGNRTRVKVVKNKVAPPFRQAEFDIIYGKGISLDGDLLDLGLEAGVLVQKGTWYTYGDLQLGQGREKARAHLEESRDVAARLERDVRASLGLPVVRRPRGEAPAENEPKPEKAEKSEKLEKPEKIEKPASPRKR